jgi:protein-tyrosine kinase
MVMAKDKMRRRAQATPSFVDTRLGELLHDDGTLTEQDIKDILTAQRDCGERFGEIASRLGLANEQDVQRALSRQADFPAIISSDSGLSPVLVAAYQPECARAEELRTLRSELMLRWFGRDHRALAVVATGPQHGCSTLAANLAITFAQLGERTLLIDANMRAPSQHSLFGFRADHGLVDFIRGREKLDDAVTRVPGFSCLSVMCAGAPPPNPQELLGRVSFGYLMESAPTKYDVVIVDTPPMLQCADALLIAGRTRGAVLATKRHQTRVDDVLRVKSQLAAADVSLLGAVIDG